MNKREQRKLVNNVLVDINKARRALGKPETTALRGFVGRATSCPVATGLGIRNSTSGYAVMVRSKKQAIILSEAWGTGYEPITYSKTYKWSVKPTESMQAFINQFDGYALKHVMRTVETRKNKKGIVTDTKMELIKGDPISTFKLNVDEATELALAMAR